MNKGKAKRQVLSNKRKPIKKVSVLIKKRRRERKHKSNKKEQIEQNRQVIQ